MPGLSDATAVVEVSRDSDQETSTARFAGELSAAWEIWGPQGGYLASLALRAAGLACGRARPGSINVHFVGVGSSGPVDIDVTTNRSTRVGTSMSIRMTQRSTDADQAETPRRVLLTASVWGIDGDLPGLEHQIATKPTDPLNPNGLPNMSERMADRDDGPPHAFWLNLESRPVSWIDDWETRTAGEPHQQNWYRFVEGETFADPWLDACRSLVVLDVDSWGAAGRAHAGMLDYFAPTIELTARFIGTTHDNIWLLSDAHAPVAADGLIAGAGTVWTTDGRLVVSGGATLLCRPAARRPDGR